MIGLEELQAPGADGSSPPGNVGRVDGSVACTTRRFQVVLDEHAVVQLDDLVSTAQRLPDGRTVTHFGIVVEGSGEIEGAEMSSDTHRIAAAKTMPGQTSRTVDVQVLRTVPELWLAPEPGAAVQRAVGSEREQALFIDQMDQPMAVGLDQAGDPVYLDFAFVSGEKGGHLSISGVSGVATKTSYATFFLYQLLETDGGRRLLGTSLPNTRALIFNTKGEDLLHLDQPNANLARHESARDEWRRLGVDEPGPFRSVRFYGARAPGRNREQRMTDVVSRTDVIPFGWSPWEFIRNGLLRFCFSDAEDARNQVSFIEQRVRIQLMRWAYPLYGMPGGVLLKAPDPGENVSYNADRLLEERREPRDLTNGGDAILDFSDLVDFLTTVIGPDAPEDIANSWAAGVTAGTRFAFLRRLYAEAPRIGQLISHGVDSVKLETAVTVVDLHALHDDAQRFVVGALLSEIFAEKQGSGRLPLRFIMLDELNKYAPREGTSPIKDLLVDIAARG